MRSPSPTLPFRPDIEGLRGLAVLLVVAYHARVPGIHGGFVGVDVFFVLSGFLITGLLVRELETTGRIDFAAFYARRIRRLLPASLGVLVGTLAIGMLVAPPLQLAASAEAAQRAASFVSNLFFASRAADYFADGIETNAMLHTWSLSVEEQFYLVWPALVLLAAGFRMRRGRLAIALGLVVVTSLTASWWLTIASRATAFYGMPTRAWEFAIGALVAMSAARREWRLSPSWRTVLSLGGAALVVGAALRFTARTEFPGWLALVPVSGTALLVACAPSWLATAPLRWVGRQSYSWYLWHWPLLVLGAGALGADTLLTRVALVIAALGLAVLTRRFVEEPCRHAPMLVRSSWRTIGMGLAGVGAVMFAGAFVHDAALDRAQTAAPGAFAAAMKDRPQLYRDDCGPGVRDSVVRTCMYGPRDARTTVALFGDSHAAHWFPALDVLARERKWRILVVTKDACPSVFVSVYEPMLQRVSRECNAWRRAAIDTLRKRRPSFVVLSNSSEYVLGGPHEEPRASVTADAWEHGLTRTLGALHDAGVPAAVIQDTPRAAENIPACLTRSGWTRRTARPCDFTVESAQHGPAVAAERRAVARFAEDRDLDLTPTLCPEGTCPAVGGGIVRYRDAHHLTAAASAALAPALEGALDRTTFARRSR